jgi:hypothetical protein
VSATTMVVCGVLIVLGVMALLAMPLYRTHDRDADSIGRIIKETYAGLADVIRAVRGR